jgi:small nuclear ribonucleoprotein (snRNP)-like protein
MRKEEVKMHEFYELKEMLMDEVRELTKKGELTAGSLDTVDKLLNSIKNACKIIMYDEYSEDGYSYADSDREMSEYSYARGRGSNARRDSMGRYSREGGYSNARGGRGYRGGRGGYSYGDGNEEKIEALREAMKDAESEQEKMIIKKMIRRMEQD